MKESARVDRGEQCDSRGGEWERHMLGRVLGVSGVSGREKMRSRYSERESDKGTKGRQSGWRSGRRSVCRMKKSGYGDQPLSLRCAGQLGEEAGSMLALWV